MHEPYDWFMEMIMEVALREEMTWGSPGQVSRVISGVMCSLTKTPFYLLDEQLTFDPEAGNILGKTIFTKET